MLAALPTQKKRPLQLMLPLQPTRKLLQWTRETLLLLPLGAWDTPQLHLPPLPGDEMQFQQQPQHAEQEQMLQNKSTAKVQLFLAPPQAWELLSIQALAQEPMLLPLLPYACVKLSLRSLQ
jgi:hypothetical protein